MRSLTLCAIAALYLYGLGSHACHAADLLSPDQAVAAAPSEPSGDSEPAKQAADSPFTGAPRASKSEASRGPTGRAGRLTPVEAALQRLVTLQAVESPLEEVTNYLSASAKVEIQIDHRALEDAGVTADEPVTIDLRKMRLKSVLNHLVRGLDLAWHVEGQVINIATPEEHESSLTTRVYAAEELLRQDDADLLTQLVTQSLEPSSWEEVGGPASIVHFQDLLIVNQTWETHQQLRCFLQALVAARDAAATHAQQAPPKTFFRAADAEGEDVGRALSQEVVLDFIETPLSDVVQFLQDTTKTPIVIDARALGDYGLDADEVPITRHIKDISLRSGLSIVLRELDLTFMVRDDAIVITTPEASESRLETRVYPVLDLVRLRRDVLPPDESLLDDYDSLTELITATVRPDTWEDVGGPSSVGAGFGCLVISQTDEAFEEIDELLHRYRGLLAEYRKNPRFFPDEPTPLAREADAGAYRALQLEIGMTAFADTPLADAAAWLSEQTKTPIVIDVRALEDVGIGSDTPISATLGGQTLADVLTRILEPLDLTWLVRDEVVLITTPEECECALVTKAYGVRDLIRSEDDLEDRAAGRLDALVDMMTRTVEPTTWDMVGGPGAASGMAHHGVLFVSQTQQTHLLIQSLFAQIRAKRDEVKAADPTDTSTEAEQDVPRNRKGERLFLKVYRLSPVPSDPVTPAEVVEVVQELVAPGCWDAEDNYYLRPVGGSLIMRHTKATHAKLRELLAELDLLPVSSSGGGLFGGPSSGNGGFPSVNGGGIFQ